MHYRIIVLILTVFTLTGAGNVWNPDTYVIVDPNAGEWKPDSVYMTIGTAVASGASTIEVREGQYPESVTLDRPLTLLCREGATLINDGLSVSLSITAAAVTVKGCEIEGSHAGGNIGGYGDGTGVYVTAPNVHLDGLITRNLRSFSVLALGTNNLLLENYHFSNVATGPTIPLLTQYAIHLNSVDDSVIRNGFVTGHSQAIGTWYSADRNRVYGNRLTNNYGYVGSVGNYVLRSAVEDYGVPGAENHENEFYENDINGSHGSGFELADSLHGTIVRNNRVRNTHNCFSALGSGTNHAIGLTFSDNHCYGDGIGGASNHVTGENVVIGGNWFYGIVNTNTGVLWVWGDTAKNVLIDGNMFVGGGTTARLSNGNVTYRDNTIIDHISGLYLRIDNSAGYTTINRNVFSGVASGIDTNGLDGLALTDNEVYGYLWLHNQTRNAVVRGNTVTTPGMWGIGLYAPTHSTVTDNRISAWNPVHIQPGTTDYLKLTDNYLTTETGGAAGLPACSGTNTCSGNWTVGQVPPP